MKWTFLIVQKLKVALAFGMVFLLVFAAIAINRKHVSTLQETFSSVYEDRLVVEGYIYKLVEIIYSKKELLENYSYDQFLNVAMQHRFFNDSIQHLLNEYSKTQFTDDETVYFKKLNDEFENMKMSETKYFSAVNPVDSSSVHLIENYNILTKYLDQLSDIQMLEGKHLLEKSLEIAASSKITYRFEIALLLVIGLIIQGLLFASKSITPKFSQKSQLN